MCNIHFTPALSRFTHWLLLLVAFLSVVGLQACAGSQSAAAGASASRGEIVTDSDETDQRKRARIRVELALGYFQQGKTNIALDEIKLAIAADPTFADAYSLRGLVYLALNDYAFAEESFNKALAIRQKDPNVLHNLGWLKCQQAAYASSFSYFGQALADPSYMGRAKTLMAQGLCQVRAGMLKEAESSFLKSYEYDAGNPVTGYNLAKLLYLKPELTRAQFYIRRLNNTEFANAESLWLGIKVEKQLGNLQAVEQLASQLEKRFAQSPEAASYHRGAFDE
jgi:type IV pilus assembly protein PilF